MRPLKFGVIGLGVGEQHVIGYQSLAGCEVAAICDVDATRLGEVGNRRGIEKRSTDWRDIVEDPGIDAISICSYDSAHAEQAIAALSAGKHVMVEKPAVLYRREAEALLRAWADSGRRLTTNVVLRRSPRFVELKSRIDSGELGEIFYLEGDYLHEILWKITSGWRGKMDFYCVTYGGGIHLIDLMRWLLGREVVEVCGMGANIMSRDTTYRWPDTIVNLMRFEGGAVAKTTTSFGVKRPHFHALSVFGNRKTFLNDVPAARLFEGDKPENMNTIDSAYPGIEKGVLLSDFVAAIRENREPLVTGRDVFRVMDVCFACWDSVEKGRTVPVSYLI